MQHNNSHLEEIIPGIISINLGPDIHKGIGSSIENVMRDDQPIFDIGNITASLEGKATSTLNELVLRFNNLEDDVKFKKPFNTYNELILPYLDTDQLIYIDAQKNVQSTHLARFVNGTESQIVVNDDVSGSITLSLPQSINTNSVPTFENVVLNGNPYAPRHVITKGYLDEILQSHEWQKSVCGFFDPTISMPPYPEKGERYISTANAKGWIKNRIYTYDGDVWDEIIPNEGYVISMGPFNDFDDKYRTYMYAGHEWMLFGYTIDHTNLKNRGKYVHEYIDRHIDNDRIHFDMTQIDHKSMQNIGRFGHEQLDAHIDNNNNAHFGQNLTVNGSPIFKNIKLSEEPIMASQCATKGYVDSLVNGIIWKKQVCSFHDPTTGPPEFPNPGSRYISMTEGGSWFRNSIYEFTGTEWNEIVPSVGWGVFVEGGPFSPETCMMYNGTDWVRFSSFYDHNTLQHIGIHDHHQIDEHILNTTDAHFGQNLGENGRPSFLGLNVEQEIKAPVGRLQDIYISDTFVKCPKNYNYVGKLVSDFSIISENIDGCNLTLTCADGNTNDPINILCMRAEGSLTNPGKLRRGTFIGSLTSIGYDGNAYQVTSNIQTVATENFSPSCHGTGILLSTTKNGTTIPNINFKFDHDGTFYCYSQTESESPSSGSIVIKGGLGISKRLFVGTDSCIGKNVYFTGQTLTPSILPDTMSGVDNKIMSLCGGGDINANRGALITLAGNNSMSNGRLTLSAGNPHGIITLNTNNVAQMTINTNGQCVINNTQKAINSETGAFIVNGGVSIKEKLYIGGSQIHLSDTNDAFICTDTRVGNDIARMSMCGGGGSSLARGGQIISYGNHHPKFGGNILIYAGQVNDASIRFSTGKTTHECGYINSQGIWNITTNIQSSCASTGSLVVEGGIGVKGNLNVRGIMTCSDRYRVTSSSYEPCNPIGGDLYYDTNTNNLRIYVTNIGWKNVVLS